MTQEELSRIFTISIENPRIIGKSKDQLRFDVILFIAGSKYAEIKGYRLIDGHIKPPQTRTGKGGYYTTFDSKDIEAVCHQHFWKKSKVPGFMEMFPNVIFPENENMMEVSQKQISAIFRS
jgi:hypothetical protein